ncbi:MAG: malate synthase G, partial [Halieaceae bacterium]|nr:malate synthase G [Halieaceae bacterium]
MSDRISISGLQVSETLYRFIEERAVPDTGVTVEAFWQGFADLLGELAPLNRSLLEKRDAIQSQMDDWCRAHRGQPLDMAEYKAFLTGIGYLVPEGEAFEVSTDNVDDEIARVAGPQLVVPVNNARYALNAANARWGSLYDAFYGTDAIPEDEGLEKGLTFNPARGAEVVARVCAFLDSAVPLTDGSHADVVSYTVASFNDPLGLSATLRSGQKTGLIDPAEFAGYRESDERLESVLLCNNGLHIEILIDPENPVSKLHPAGICDVQIESAVTTIMDCED